VIEGVFRIGERFQQHKETIHIAVELIDQYYLSMSQSMSSDRFKQTYLGHKDIILF
jgi:hypothetical protein